MERIKKIILEANSNPDFRIPQFMLDKYDLKEGDEIEIFEKDDETIVAKFKRN